MRDPSGDHAGAWQALGEVRYGPTEQEKGNVQYRRSLYVTKDMRAGEIFTEKNVRAIRPGLGLPPKHYDAVLGKRIRRDAVRGTPVAWDLIEDPS